MGQPYATSPGVPAPIVEALRRAFDATMKDPAYIAKMNQANMDFDPATGEEMTEIVDPDDQRAEIRDRSIQGSWSDRAKSINQLWDANFSKFASDWQPRTP